MNKILGWTLDGLKFVPIIGEAVNAVEALLGKVTGVSGDDKKTAALSLASSITALVDGVDPSLLADSDVQDATGKLIDAVVAFQNIVAKAKAAKATTSAK